MPERFSSERATRMRRYQPKHELVSIVAYLIGVPKQIFENEYEPPQLQYYTQLDQNRKARIIRNLCILRTDFQRNFSKIFYAFRDGSDIWSMKDWVSIESISQLERDNCRIYQRERSIYNYFLLPANYKYRETKG